MKIIGNMTYRNDDGEVISKDEFDILCYTFQKKVDNAYNAKANQIISRINSVASNEKEKLWMLFDDLTSDNMSYDLQGTDGRGAYDYGYVFPPYKSWKIRQGTKYPVLLYNSGVCETYALAFEDLANKLGIPCRVVSGDTGMLHAWNVVLINNQLKQIDVTYAIICRKTHSKEDFFLKDTFPNRIITSNISDLKESMEEQYAQQHSRFHVVSRTNNQQHPHFHVVSRTDNNEEESKITNRRT